jgi:hypothetical protein
MTVRILLVSAALVFTASAAQAGTVVVKDRNGNMVTTSTVSNMSECRRNAHSLGYKQEAKITEYCTNLMHRLGKQ